MSKRNYNVFFHTHTVSGIVISVALYIIFFCGAFALIKDEIEVWEKGDEAISVVENIDYNKIVSAIQKKGHLLYGRDVRMIPPQVGHEMYVTISASKDTTVAKEAQEFAYFKLDLETFKEKEYYAFYSLGEFLYRLHFFAQIPRIGVYLTGFVALFFLFAIVTGVIIHWKKMVSNFFLFRPKAKLKALWTDAHTALGVIGLPFQFMYALTSCFMCLTILILIPANFFYDNDQEQLLEDFRPMSKTYELGTPATIDLDVNNYMSKATARWEHFVPQQVYLKSFGSSNMKFQVDGWVTDKFIGNGSLVFDIPSNTIYNIKDPYETTYLESIEMTIRRFHYGNFGGKLLKIIYFILALITCFVIISGVLIWLEARNKKQIPLVQQYFNRKVGHIYIAICLSLYPVTAICFILSKLLPRSFDPDRQTIIYSIFFGLWLLFSLFYRFKRHNYFVNKNSLLIGGIAGLLIPIINGIVFGNWMWYTYANGFHTILFIDLFWLILGAITIWIAYQLPYKAPAPPLPPLPKPTKTNETNTTINIHKKTLKMKMKIAFLWLLIAIGFILHHIYGLATVFFKEAVFIEGSTGDTPNWAHMYRILFEGMALVFCLLSLQTEKPWFKTSSLVWALLLGLFNVYHFITALIGEATNFSEILILGWMVAISIILLLDLKKYRRTN